MASAEDLLRALVADPTNESIRLAYAHALKELGDPLGTHVELCLESERRKSAGDPDWRRFADRVTKFQVEHEDELQRPFREIGVELVGTELGLPAAVRASGEVLAANADRLHASAPLLSRLCVTEAEGRLDPIVAHSLVRRVRILDLSGNRLEGDDFRALAKSPQLGELRRLHLNDCRFEDLTPLTQGRFERLLWLELKESELSDDEFKSLMRSKAFPSLRSLDLSNSARENLDGIGKARGFPSLDSLCLRNNWIDAAGWKSLVRSPLFRQLSVLDLSQNPLGDDPLLAKVAYPATARLSVLLLTSCDLGNRLLESLARNAQLPDLKTLDLESNRSLGDDGVLSLLDSSWLANLADLYLGATGVTNEGVVALVNSEKVRRLRGLSLRDRCLPPALDERAFVAIAESTNLASLEELHIGGNLVGGKALDALAAPERLPALRKLDVPQVWMTESQAEALRARCAEVVVEIVQPLLSDSNFDEIEARLGIVLPDDYRTLLRDPKGRLKGEWFEGECSLYTEPERIAGTNLDHRPDDSPTSEAFPRWYDTFFLIGTNGGGDYYCLRLDGTPGVWIIGSDCGEEPEQVAESLEAYIEKLVADWRAELARREAVEARRRLRAAETDAHLAAIERQGGPDRARDWATEHRPNALIGMLDELLHRPGPRKLRLFGLACCGLIPDLEDDATLASALQVAREMTLGIADELRIDETRSSLATALGALRALWSATHDEEYGGLSLSTRAVFDLFQSDRDYRTRKRTAYEGDYPLFPGDAPALEHAYDAVSYRLYDRPYGSDVEAHLLREVLGNPFHPVEFPPEWRTEAVLDLARTMFDDDRFDRMPELADALEAAGCDDARVLCHCRQSCGHVRGCWVVDGLLELDPKPSGEFTWDFTLKHPSIDLEVVKERLRAFGVRPDDGGTIDDDAALEFADWLEAHGDPHWAAYVRTRCRLDGRVPGEDYPDRLEEWIEAGDRMPYMAVDFEGFYLGGHSFAEPAWWERHFPAAPWIRGLPTIVDAVPPGDGPRPVELVARQWEALVRNSSVRGIDFQWHYAGELDAFFASPAASHVRWLSFDSRPADGTRGPLDALVRSAVAARIERLEIEGHFTEAEVEALANADFGSLRRLRLPSVRGVGEPLDRLMNAPWFRGLEHLELDLWDNEHPNALRALAGMTRLHSLSVFRPCPAQFEALGDPCELPALRRLEVHGGLTDPPTALLGRIRAPLAELDLSGFRRESLAGLLASPLCAGLRVLHLAGPMFDQEGFAAVASCPCAAELRILRLVCGDGDCHGRVASLASTPLAGGAFPNLTTLDLRMPYAASATPDTAAFLSGLATPRLRHLNLEECFTDDECARILGTEEKFATLRRVTIREWSKRDQLITPEGAALLAESRNLAGGFAEVDLL